ncbi:hypothetical protein A3860_12125 [Niastella vici]|uniref:Uncharacterized protein n=1 Tax=Niastella vici TaxID=1703345 RepID=A0A1V9G6H6_9BACT|nr:hypothetical protein [Niastella vici]OQP66245.1 hypothetical protein A3860_12125 [Niastella vici]
MISDKDFDHFLRNGYIEGLLPGTSLETLLCIFGHDHWYVKEIENNGLIYGIIKVGFIEFHIIDEKFNGISYRPDISFPKKDFKGVRMPWIYKNRQISLVEEKLNAKSIVYKRYVVSKPLNNIETAAGTFIGLSDCDHHFIDTVGGVTFSFDYNENIKELEARQICKYYDIHKKDSEQI